MLRHHRRGRRLQGRRVRDRVQARRRSRGNINCRLQDM